MRRSRATGPCRRKLLLQGVSSQSFWHFFRFILADGISGAQAASRRSGWRQRHLAAKGRHLGEPILVTGVAGFIGMHVARRLLSDGYDVVGVDNLNAYYDPGLKQARVAALEAFPPLGSNGSTLPTASPWRDCSQPTAFPMSCISRRKPACAIP